MYHLGSEALFSWTADGSGGHCWSAERHRMTGSGCTCLWAEWSKKEFLSSLNVIKSQRQRIASNKRNPIQIWDFFFFFEQSRYLRSFLRLTKMLKFQVKSGLSLDSKQEEFQKNWNFLDTQCCSTLLSYWIFCFLWRDTLASIFLIKLLLFLPIAHVASAVKPFFVLSVSPYFPFPSVFFFLFILFVLVLCSPVTFHCVCATPTNCVFRQRTC